MVMHEIGFLLIAGIFDCLLSFGVQSCPNSENIIPPALAKETDWLKYENRDVGYEVSSLLVFEIKGEKYQIRKKTGEKIWLDLGELNKLVQKNLPPDLTAEEKKDNKWFFRPLEEVVNTKMIHYDGDIFKFLTESDLKTPKKMSEANEQDRQDSNLPVAFIEALSPCAEIKLPTGGLMDKCSSAEEINVYSNPQNLEATEPSQSDKIIKTIKLSAENFHGISSTPMSKSKTVKIDKILIYTIKKEASEEWLSAGCNTEDCAGSRVWLKKSDIKHKVIQIPLPEQLDLFQSYLNSSDSTNTKTGRDNKETTEIVIKSAKETKWKDGVLWIKVDILMGSFCEGDDPKKISEGWLPYHDPKTGTKKMDWYSRGC
jgi:hypothetical protein